MARRGKVSRLLGAVTAVLVVLLPLLTPWPAGARTDRWATWTPITGTSNNYALRLQQRAPGFPEAAVATDSRANVQLAGGSSTFLGASTPPGAKYGTSQGSPYVVLRPRADNASAPSTTTYSFDRPTPDTGWAFVLGDIDSDQVQVRALDASGSPVPAAQVDGWFRGAFNYANGTDLPTWNALGSTLVGNPSATDTDGASGWFEPDVSLSSLTFVFTRRAGFPVYQAWFVSRARPIGGTVADVSTSGTCAVEDSVLTLLSPSGEQLATTSPSSTGAYAFGEFATQAGYTVRVTAPEGCAIVGPAAATVDNRGDDGTPASLANFSVRRIIPQPISGTVTDTGGQPVAGVTVTLTRPDSSTVTRTTGTDGSYLFDDNPVADGYALAVTVPEGYAAGPDGTAITGIDVATVAITGQDFVVRALPGVAGRVTGGGNGLGGVPVTLTPVGGGPSLTTVTIGDGSYLFPHVAAGDYTISVDAPAGYAGDTTRPATVAADDLTDEDFALTRPGSATGAVTDEDGGGVADVPIEITGPGPATTVTTDEAGSYVVDGLDPGAYTARVTPPRGYAVDGPATLSFTITDAGEIRGGQDFRLVAVATPSPSPSPTPSPTTSTPTPSGTVSSTTSGTGVTVGGSLADTGGPPVTPLVLGAALLAGGLVLVGLSRLLGQSQRRTRRA